MVGIFGARTLGLFLLGGSLQERRDVGPELAPGFLLGLGQLGEGFFVAETNQAPPKPAALYEIAIPHIVRASQVQRSALRAGPDRSKSGRCSRSQSTASHKSAKGRRVRG